MHIDGAIATKESARPLRTRRRRPARIRRWSLLAGVLLTAASIAPAAVSAKTLPTVAECAAIDTDSERLACYDRASGRTAGPPSPTEPAPPRAEQPVQADAGSRPGKSLIDSAWGFDPHSDRYIIDAYNQNYLLVARYTNNVNSAPFSPVFSAAGQPENINSTEAKFQISAKMRLLTSDDRQWGLWVGYTQQSQWQVYNGDVSRPFRETNYMPELFVSYRPGLEIGGFNWNLLNVGYNHQSNGRSNVVSRSWDRIIATFGFERKNFALLAKAWIPFNDEEDNPDIADYYGYGSLTGIYKWRDHSFSLMARGNVAEGHGAAELTWMSPKFLGPLRAYVQAFTGYGESMIDYNWNQSTIGFGIALNDTL